MLLSRFYVLNVLLPGIICRKLLLKIEWEKFTIDCYYRLLSGFFVTFTIAEKVSFAMPWFVFSATATSIRFDISDVFIFFHGHQHYIYYLRYLHFLPWPPASDLTFQMFLFSFMATSIIFIFSDICIFCHGHQHQIRYF